MDLIHVIIRNIKNEVEQYSQVPHPNTHIVYYR